MPPIYEYECKDCSHNFDHLQKLSDEDLTTCPKCGKTTLQRLISPCAFTLHGSGWYKKGFSGKAYSNQQRELAEKKEKANKDES